MDWVEPGGFTDTVMCTCIGAFSAADINPLSLIITLLADFKCFNVVHLDDAITL